MATKNQPTRQSSNTSQYTSNLAKVYHVDIDLGDGIHLTYRTSLIEEDAWVIHFPEKGDTGVGCSPEVARNLILASNGPNTKVGYSYSHMSDAEIQGILQEKAAKIQGRKL